MPLGTPLVKEALRPLGLAATKFAASAFEGYADDAVSVVDDFVDDASSAYAGAQSSGATQSGSAGTATCTEAGQVAGEVVDDAFRVDINFKPSVANDKLKNIINDLYKGQGGPNTIGNGTTMDAVRNELQTGLPTNGRYHTQKLYDYLNALQRRLRAGDLNDYDRAVTNSLIEDILKALNGN